MIASGALVMSAAQFGVPTPTGCLALAFLLLALPSTVCDVCRSVLGLQSLTCILGCASFKLGSLAMGRGVLARELSFGCSLWRFVGVLLLPVIPTNAGMPAPKNASAAVAAKLQRSVLKLGTFGLSAMALAWALHSPLVAGGHPTLTGSVIKFFLFYLSGLALWQEVDGMADLMDAIALGLFGIEAEPHFCNPMMSVSLAEFWGKRWNLTMSSLLRDLVFDPICENSFKPRRPVTAQSYKPPATVELGGAVASEATAKGREHPYPSITTRGSSTQGQGTQQQQAGAGAGEAQPARSTDGSVLNAGRDKARGASRLRKFLGSCATFIVSGTWHELVFWNMTGGHTTSGYWTLFFLVQAPLIAMEALMDKKLSKAGVTLPKWAGILKVNLICAVLVCFLWIPPMTWQLPNPCVSGRATINLIEAAQQQGARDIQGVMQRLTTTVPVLGGMMATDASLGSLVSWVKEALSTITG